MKQPAPPPDPAEPVPGTDTPAVGDADVASEQEHLEDQETDPHPDTPDDFDEDVEGAREGIEHIIERE